MSSMRTIRVTGKGQIRLRPDTTRIAISLEGIYPEYSEMLQHSAQDTECLRDILAGFGFERSELKNMRGIMRMAVISRDLWDINSSIR